MKCAAIRPYIALVAVLFVSSCTAAPPPGTEAEITAVVDSFYGSMKKDDGPAVMRLLAPDALFVESGKLETRAEYEANHLPADIQFETQVTGKRAPMRITFNGDTAWVIATTEYTGTFDGDPVNFASAQLMVLTRNAGEWLIRTIHWSSRRLD